MREIGRWTHRQTAGAESVFRNNFFGKQMHSSERFTEVLEICFPKKLFLKTRREATACRLPNPPYLHYLQIPFVFSVISVVKNALSADWKSALICNKKNVLCISVFSVISVVKNALQMDEAFFDGDGNCVGSIRGAQLIQNMTRMRFHCAFSDSKQVRNFLIASSRGNQFQYF
jgi:hypothetical protein